MTEFPAGTYTSVVAQLYPLHGDALVTTRVTCPGGSVEDQAFNVYIDPSGRIVDANGDPVEGATVTLLRSDNESGPYDIVPDGSAIMSPANRTNPQTSDSAGRFGWDVVPGWYKVRAEKDGCTAPDSTATFVETDALPVPPPQLDLELRLDCGGSTPDTVKPTITCPTDRVFTLGEPIQLGTPVVQDDRDPNPTVTNSAPGTFAPGRSLFTWKATDAAGNQNRCYQAVYVVYDWTGFLAPTKNRGAGTNRAFVGVPFEVRWNLTDVHGTSVTDAGTFSSLNFGYLTSLAGGSLSAQPVLPTSSSLEYEAATDEWVLSIVAPGSWAGKAKTLTVNLDDGTAHQAVFAFRRPPA
jgi:hypothetical protein